MTTMTLSEAITICECAAATAFGQPCPTQEGVAPDDWVSAARIMLPKMRALRTTLDAASPLGIELPERRVTPFMDKCLRMIEQAG